jgi:hypothetical protein
MYQKKKNSPNLPDVVAIKKDAYANILPTEKWANPRKLGFKMERTTGAYLHQIK